VIVLAAWLAGHTPATAVRRALAPSVSEHVRLRLRGRRVILLLIVLWGRSPQRGSSSVLGFAILIGLGIRDCRKDSVEFPTRRSADTSHALRAWLEARRGHTRAP